MHTEERKKENRDQKALFLVSGAVLACLVALLLTSLAISNRLTAATYERLLQESQTLSGSFSGYLKRQEDTLCELGALIAANGAPEGSALASAFEVAEDLGGFADIRFADKSGTLRDADGGADVSGERFFQTALGGTRTVAYLPSMADGRTPGLILSVPVQTGDEVAGVLFASLTHEALRRQIGLSTFGEKGVNVLLSADGRVIGSTGDMFLPGDSFADAVQASNSAGGKALAQQLETGLITRGTGTYSFLLGQETFHAGVAQIAPSSFLVVSGVPESAAAKLESTDAQRMLLFAAGILVVFAGMLIYVLHTNRRHVLQLQNEKELLKRSEERYRFLENLTNDIIFEVDMRTRRVTFNRNYHKHLSFLPNLKTIDDLFQQNKRVCAEDREFINNMVESMRAGEERAEAQFRIYADDNVLVWLHVQCYAMRDDAGNAVRLLGKIMNIDKQKRELQRLQGRAAQDSLTKVYNRETTQNKIDEFLALQRKSGLVNRHALMVVDLDGFKRINDTYGHLTGDHLLMALAEEMRKVFRSSDIVGRMGGDEFVAFLKDIGDDAHAYQKGEELCATVRALSAQFHNGLQVTCSIGVCPCSGPDLTNFDELYQKADSALYLAKSRGKNQCIAYNGACSA
ncbi:MAG TPA: diguanylate cyclase [Feifaniaceae bacterium]|nr:diguanylate cyclase [Feifaniaceae bacterium]